MSASTQAQRHLCHFSFVSPRYLGLFLAPVNCSSQVDGSLQRGLVVVCRRGRSLRYRWGSTGNKLYWGAPRCYFFSLATTYSRYVLPEHSTYPTDMFLGASLLCVGRDTTISPGSGSHSLDLPPSPPSSKPVSYLKSFLPLREGDKSSQISPTHSTMPPSYRSGDSTITCRFSAAAAVQVQRPSETLVSVGLILDVGLRSSPAFIDLKSSLSASKPIGIWGNLVSLAKFLIIVGGFTKIITEVSMLLMFYSSYVKSCIIVRVPVGLPGPPSYLPSLATFFLKKRIVLSPTLIMRNVFPPNVKRRCVLISITVLLSCVAVRSGSEDATEFVSTIFRGADWVLTSRLKVTTFQVFSSAMNFIMMHSSPALNSLSSYLRVLAISYVVLSFGCRVSNNSLFYCNSNVFNV